MQTAGMYIATYCTSSMYQVRIYVIWNKAKRIHRQLKHVRSLAYMILPVQLIHGYIHSYVVYVWLQTLKKCLI